MLKIVFMGTPDFAETSLEKVYEEGYDIIGVVTNPDKPKGRKMILTPSPVKEFALEKKLKVYQPEKIRKNIEFIETIKKLNPDVICVVAYGKILPKELLEIPRLGCINVHGSLLPKYRGAAPIQWAVINGDKTTGITTMYMDVGMDTGDIILKKEVEIGEDETTGELWERLKNVGANLLIKTLKQIEEGMIKRIPQGENFTIAPMLEKEIGKINWEEKTGNEIKNLVRGLNPIMGAYTFIQGKKIKFWKVNVISNQKLFELFPDLAEYAYRLDDITSGTVMFSGDKNGLYIKAKDSIIEVVEIQAENNKKMNIYDFLRGNNIRIRRNFRIKLETKY